MLVDVDRVRLTRKVVRTNQFTTVVRPGTGQSLHLFRKRKQVDLLLQHPILPLDLLLVHLLPPLLLPRIQSL